MRKKERLVNKAHMKMESKKCFFCGNEDYCTLDLHRIIPGSKGGRYTRNNTVASCSNCHRKIHDGKIRIDRRYPSTEGWVLHYWDEKGIEHWD